MIFFVLLACFVVVNGNRFVHDMHQPQPYSFGYTIKDKEGQQHRQEAGNGAGVVEGNYGFIDNKGLQRQVNYVADHAGFRAKIKTNEPGTAGQSPAATRMLSNDPYAHGAAVPYVSRVNDPVVPALYESDGVYGFPTIYGHQAYGYGPVQSHGLRAPMYDNAHLAPVHGHGLLAQGYGKAPYIPIHGDGLYAPVYGNAALEPLGDGYGYGGSMYGPKYLGGLAHSNLLGAGYRGHGGVVNFGANLIGGAIRGFDTRFTNL